jgi:hypothetical protein
MEIILELLFEFFGELILQLIAEIFVDSSTHGAKKVMRRSGRPSKPVDPMLAACGYVAAGWLAGMLSLWLVPQLFIRSQMASIAGLLLVPIASGLIMMWIGSWRKRHDKQVNGIETFAYGFCFAFTMSLVRLIWGHGA